MRRYAPRHGLLAAAALTAALLPQAGLADNGKIVLGMSLAQIKKNFTVVRCQRDPSNSKVSYAITMTPEYWVGGVPAFLRVEFAKGECVDAAIASRITVWFDATRADAFLAAAKAPYHFGPNTVAGTDQPDKRCEGRGDLPKYMHTKWEHKDEDVQFWSFKDRLCAAKLVYTRPATPAGTRSPAKP